MRPAVYLQGFKRSDVLHATILIVEDEIVVASDLEAMLEELGHSPVGIAPDSATALALADATKPDIALVDLNLRDGPTGREIGAELSRRGIIVLFLTANPRSIASGVPGALGVMCKPCDEDCIDQAIGFALAHRRGELRPPPPSISLFGEASSL